MTRTRSKEPALSIRVKQAHASQRYKEHWRSFSLVFVLSLVALGKVFFSTLHTSDGLKVDIPADGAAFLSNESLVPLMNPSYASSGSADMVFLGGSDLVGLPFLDSGSMTAIFPADENSLEKVHETVELLVSDESSVSAITIVCPEGIVPVLHTMLLGRHMDTFVDINVAIWGEGLSEGSAIMSAAAGLSTEYALVIASEGLQDLHAESRAHLLSHQLLLDVPTGFCGGNITKSGEQPLCAVPDSESRAASFLLPPFIVPTSLIRGLNLTATSDREFWIYLGNALTQENGIGAFILESDRSSDKNRCYMFCGKYGLSFADASLAQCSTKSNSDEGFGDRGEPSQSSSLAIILPTLGDLEDFSSVTCRLSENGYTEHVLILSHELDHASSHDSSFPWLHDHLISSVCNISYSALHISSNDFANAEAVRFWLESANETMSVIIYGSGELERASELPFASVLESQSALGITVIRIPQPDLAYSDWLASLTLPELRNWHVPDVEISVITDNRPNSLERLLRSLLNAHYFGDPVPVRINVEQTADLKTRKIVGEFQWKHGGMFVHHRVVHGGLLTSVVESWYPHSNDSYGVLLEDDVEVSPLFYAWIKMTLLRYRYGDPSNRQDSLFGISLYQQKQIELRPEGRRPFDAQVLFDTYGVLYHNTPYISQIPCSWGAVYFPEHWREFHSFLMVRFSEAWLPLRDIVVPHVRSNRWAKSWKRFFIELAYLRGYVMLYPNYDDFVSLSTNHLEVGSHVKEQPRSIYEQKKALFTLPLMTLPERGDEQDDSQTTGLLDLPEEQLPSWSDLPVLDLWGQLSSETVIQSRGTERQKELVGCTTIGSSEDRRRPFEPEDLFSCIVTAVEEIEAEDELEIGEIHYDI